MNHFGTMTDDGFGNDVLHHGGDVTEIVSRILYYILGWAHESQDAAASPADYWI